MTTQYDNIGEKYDPIKMFPVHRYGETFTIKKMLGDLQGKCILDLACGTGFYTRILKKLGAAKVIGVDISKEMLAVAKQQEANDPLGISYIESDVITLSEDIGKFDLVLAVYLLNYAPTEETLKEMLQKVYDLLVPGGQFIAYTVNPDFTLEKGDMTPYKFTVVHKDERPIPNRQPIRATIHLDTPIVIDSYQWDAVVYEKLMTQVGFRDIFWHPAEVDPEGIKEFGQAFWNEYIENSLICGLSCIK